MQDGVFNLLPNSIWIIDDLLVGVVSILSNGVIAAVAKGATRSDL